MDRLQEVAEALTALAQGRKGCVSEAKTLEAVLGVLNELGIMHSVGSTGIVYQIEIETTEKAAPSHELVEALTKLVSDLDYLIGGSYGVAGLHQNGEIAPWGDLTKGGQFEEWLSSLEGARATLAAVKGA